MIIMDPETANLVLRLATALEATGRGYHGKCDHPASPEVCEVITCLRATELVAEALEALPPTEPAIGAVVLVSECAYQRDGAGDWSWYEASTEGRGNSWSQLIALGKITVLWTPPDPDPAP